MREERLSISVAKCLLMSEEYITLKLPKSLVEEIDRFIAENPQLGYKSRAEVVKEAVRQMIIFSTGLRDFEKLKSEILRELRKELNISE